MLPRTPWYSRGCHLPLQLVDGAGPNPVKRTLAKSAGIGLSGICRGELRGQGGRPLDAPRHTRRRSHTYGRARPATAAPIRAAQNASARQIAGFAKRNGFELVGDSSQGLRGTPIRKFSEIFATPSRLVGLQEPICSHWRLRTAHATSACALRQWHPSARTVSSASNRASTWLNREEIERARSTGKDVEHHCL